MAQVEEVGDSKKRHISTSMTNFPRDLLQRFISANHLPVKLEEQDDAEDELELTLGLSLNGRFGVDPRAKKIKRTASIPEFVNPVRDEDTAYVVPLASPLIRTCSLPTETEEEWRKRKELQTLRRMEARRKRLEKQRNSKAVKEKNRSMSEEIGEENNRTEQVTVTMNDLSIRGCRVGLDGSGELPPLPPCSQGSSGSSSNGTGSSGISESECQQAQGMRSVEARSRIGANSSPDGEQKSPVTLVTTTAENSGKIAADTMRNQPYKLISRENSGTREILRKQLLEDLPCVSTKGEGPNGKRIEGFLYRYRKGEQVRIVCVCHGRFLTPAEFVKHAGGGDVAHPLKHIVVSPSFM